MCLLESGTYFDLHANDEAVIKWQRLSEAPFLLEEML